MTLPDVLRRVVSILSEESAGPLPGTCLRPIFHFATVTEPEAAMANITLKNVPDALYERLKSDFAIRK